MKPLTITDDNKTLYCSIAGYRMRLCIVGGKKKQEILITPRNIAKLRSWIKGAETSIYLKTFPMKQRLITYVKNQVPNATVKDNGSTFEFRVDNDEDATIIRRLAGTCDFRSTKTTEATNFVITVFI